MQVCDICSTVVPADRIMENSPEITELKGLPGLGKVQSAGVMVVVGVAFTIAVLVMLGHFTRPERIASPGDDVAVENPFASQDATAQPLTVDEEACRVMSNTINDINARMSQGVTEAQARYFRSRRNKLYLLMRERCGV